jgi:hypothetical protein
MRVVAVMTEVVKRVMMDGMLELELGAVGSTELLELELGAVGVTELLELELGAVWSTELLGEDELGRGLLDEGRVGSAVLLGRLLVIVVVTVV